MDFDKPADFNVADLERDHGYVMEWSANPHSHKGDGALGIYLMSNSHTNPDTIEEGAYAYIDWTTCTITNACSASTWAKMEPVMLEALKRHAAAYGRKYPYNFFVMPGRVVSRHSRNMATMPLLSLAT